ncbi:MAG: acetylglutamate kinase [Candidatus Micrarchaeia archaeon]
MALRETLVIKLSGKMAARMHELVPQIKEVRKERYVILVHGGQEQLSALLQRMGKQTRFVEGRRVTDAETLALAKMAFGKLNLDWVEALENEGIRAVGLAGVYGASIVGKAAEERGLEGDVVKVDNELFRELMEKYVIVIPPLIYDKKNKTILNADADDIATQVAKSLGAKLMIIGELKGLLGKDGRVIPRITTRELGKLIEEKVVTGGMIPKMRACIEARLPKVWILDGSERAVILRALEGEKIGTMIVGG